MIPMLLPAWLLALVALLSPASGIGPQEEEMEARCVDGSVLRGVLAGISNTGALRLRTAKGMEELPTKNLVSLTGAQGPLPPPPRSVRLDLVSGDVLVGLVEQGNFDEVGVTTLAAGPVRLLLDHLRQATYLDNLRDGLLLPDPLPEDDDLVLLSGERLDRLPGELLRIEPAGVVFSSAAGKERLFSFVGDRVVAVRLVPLPAPAAPSEVLAVARFRDGTRLTGVLQGGPDGETLLRLTQGPTLTLACRHLQSLHFKNEAFRQLSDLEPLAFQETPYLEGGPTFGILRDRGFGGDEVLRIGSRSYRKGLGLHARSEISYELGAHFARFTADVGVDPLTRDRSLPGSVRLRIFKDATLAWESPLLVAGEEPLPVDVGGLEEVRLLRIVVDFGESFQTGARAVLADAMLHARH